MQTSVMCSSSRVVRTSRRTCVAPRASLLTDAADGMVRIFSPPSSNLKNIQRTTSSYSGEKQRTRKSGPFKDGFMPTSKPASKPVSTIVAKAETVEPTGNVVEYLGKAFQALVGKNFSRPSEEPEWMNSEHKGYSGPAKRGKGGAMYGTKR